MPFLYFQDLAEPQETKLDIRARSVASVHRQDQAKYFSKEFYLPP